MVSLHDPYVSFWEEFGINVSQDMYNLDAGTSIVIFSSGHQEYAGNDKLIKHLNNQKIYLSSTQLEY